MELILDKYYILLDAEQKEMIIYLFLDNFILLYLNVKHGSIF